MGTLSTCLFFQHCGAEGKTTRYWSRLFNPVPTVAHWEQSIVPAPHLWAAVGVMIFRRLLCRPTRNRLRLK